jgi:hypothetical protein
MPDSMKVYTSKEAEYEATAMASNRASQTKDDYDEVMARCRAQKLDKPPWE